MFQVSNFFGNIGHFTSLNFATHSCFRIFYVKTHHKVAEVHIIVIVYTSVHCHTFGGSERDSVSPWLVVQGYLGCILLIFVVVAS